MLIKRFLSEINYLSKPVLLIPGPVSTSRNIKEAMIHDIASRQHDFVKVIKSVNKKILDIGKVSSKHYTSILLQGAGTYANESVLGNLNPDCNLAVYSNGVYGNRLYEIGNILDLNTHKIDCNEDKKITVKDLENNWKDTNTHIALVHHETSNGIENDINEIAPYVKSKNNCLIVDGISSFGGIPINIEKLDIDYFVSSANKCLHSFPGISFVIAKKSTLEKNKFYRRSLSLDLYGQYKDFNENGQFRFTPPPQIVNALDKSLDELLDKGGVDARYKRYKFLNNILRSYLYYHDIKPYINIKEQGPICVLFEYPWDNFNFYDLYLRLLKKNIVIYSAQIKNKDIFRLGNIGDFKESEFKYCLDQIVIEINNMKKDFKRI